MLVSLENGSIIFLSYYIDMLLSTDINNRIIVTSLNRYDYVVNIFLNVNTCIRREYKDHCTIALFEVAVQ
jgi:hypothetical protein